MSIEPLTAENGHGPLPYQFKEYLPSLYRTDRCAVLHGFLAGLEDTWAPIEQFLEDVSVPFDTRRTPEGFLQWLASWIGITLNQNWPERKRRVLLREAVRLYQIRGTREGLQEILRIYTGVRPHISEPFLGSPFGPNTVIGVNAVVGKVPEGCVEATVGDVPDHCFVVTVFIADDEEVDAVQIREILDAEKPAHTAYELRVERRRIVQAAPASPTPIG